MPISQSSFTAEANSSSCTLNPCAFPLQPACGYIYRCRKVNTIPVREYPWQAYLPELLALRIYVATSGLSSLISTPLHVLLPMNERGCPFVLVNVNLHCTCVSY